MRRRRQKMKDEGRYVEYKEKVKQAVKKSRTKKKKAIARLPKHVQENIKKIERKKCKERVMKCRKMKAERLVAQTLPPGKESPAYKSAKSLGKATARLKKVLPNSPRKKVSVVKKLFQVIVESNNDSKQEITSISPPGPTALSAGTVKHVTNFYQRDDISRQAPGMKDTVTVRHNDGSKTKEQARHLLSSVVETYALFKQEYEDIHIGKSKFFQLQYVQSMSFLAAKFLSTYVFVNTTRTSLWLLMHFTKLRTISLNIVIASLKHCSAAPPQEQCWLANCQICKDSIAKKLEECLDEDSLGEASWFVWREDLTGHLKKMVEEGSLQELADHISSLTPQFIEHTYAKREQAKSYQAEREQAASTGYNSNMCLMQVDFSENYSCFYQDEIQSVHWHQSQVSLLTASIWYSGIQHPVVIVSDNLNHSKETVVAYIDILLGSLPTNVTEVHIWSDGPSSQFKNRFIVASISKLEEKYLKIITWNYFATSHGKGPVDGIGGSVKRQVRDAVKRRKQNVTCASEFVKICKTVTNVHVSEATAADISERNRIIGLDEIIDKAPTIHGISRIHAFNFIGGEVQTYFLSKDIEANIPRAQKVNKSKLIKKGALDAQTVASGHFDEVVKVDDWYLVDYEGKEYPGVVTEATVGNYKVNVMQLVGLRSWKWPNPKDEIWYTREHLVRKITPPLVINRMEHFQFNDV